MAFTKVDELGENQHLGASATPFTYHLEDAGFLHHPKQAEY